MNKPDINWSQIKTVLLDMDGTLLDLNFDNHFWQEHVPLRYAELHNLSIEESKAVLFPKFRSAEGTLDWYPIDQLAQLPMWEGDRHFLHLVFDDDPRVFHGYMPYKNGRPLSWHYERI